LSAEQGYALAESNLGLMYEEGQGVKQNYEEAIKWYRLAAKQGLAGAQSKLGFMYENGNGVMQDYKESVRFYRQSAKQGNVLGKKYLGMMYALGRGVSKNYIFAYMWWNLCSYSGDKDCAKNINLLENKMSPIQIEKAQKMARNWQETETNR
jgi:TPR repeat protein